VAKMKNKKNEMGSAHPAPSSRTDEFDTTENFKSGEAEGDTEDAAEEANYQAAGSRQAVGVASPNQPRREMNGKRSQGLSREFEPTQLLESAREFIEGHPGRATLIGAVIGGAAAGLFATERGRSLVRAAYSYARPMLADYARGFVNANTENAIESALPQ